MTERADLAAIEARPPFLIAVSSGMEPTDEGPEPFSEELLARLDEMNRVRDRAAAESANYWIG
jgi:hypothetical protein